jgi:enolase-phosphatase E1
VRVQLRARGIRAVLLDIEGTTTPVAFVYDVLFPFARRRLRPYLREHLDLPELREPLDRLHQEWTRDVASGAAPPPWEDQELDHGSESIARYAEWLMDRDRKAVGLKALQGLIWEAGYREGALHGDVFSDVPEALERWRAAGMSVAIFSSGSVLAQQTLFRTTPFGDLTRWLTAFFDTTVGAKTSPESYRAIASALSCPPERVLFVSDTVAEIEAARVAGCAAVICVRPGERDQKGPDADTIEDFSAIE